MIYQDDKQVAGTAGSPYTSQVKMPTAADLTSRNQQGLVTTAMPSLSVYTPDYGSLEKSFNDILASYDAYKQAAQSGYEANKASLTSNLEQQMQSIGTAKTENKQAFAQGQQQLASDVFMLNRQNKAAMSARGLGGSGIEALSNIQNRMAAGESISKMSNQFFDAQTQLVEAEQNARTNYDNSLQNLNASLQSTMAQIMSQEASSKMDYTQTVESMKRQVIADTNAMKQAQYEWQAARDQALQGATITNSMIQDVLAGAGTPEERANKLMDFNYTAAEAKAAVLNYDNKASANMYQGLQDEVNNLISQGVTNPTTIKNTLTTKYGSGTIDFNRLNLAGTTSASLIPSIANNVNTQATTPWGGTTLPSGITSLPNR